MEETTKKSSALKWLASHEGQLIATNQRSYVRASEWSPGLRILRRSGNTRWTLNGSTVAGLTAGCTYVVTESSLQITDPAWGHVTIYSEPSA